MKFSNIWETYSEVDLKHPKISMQRVTQHGFSWVAIDYYLRFCANIYHQEILSFLRHRGTYTNTTWAQKDIKMAPSSGGLSEKNFSFV